MMRFGPKIFSLILLLALTGCQGFRYLLPGHSDHERTAPVQMEVGQSIIALKTPIRMPVPGGFWLGLASDNPDIVRTEIEDGFGGSSRVTLHAVGAGTATVHYVNLLSVGGDAHNEEERKQLREMSGKSFQVTIALSANSKTRLRK
jgi:hypothetical protein